MKQLFLSFTFIFCLFSISSICAQNAINNNSEAWTINYYGATTVVPASTFSPGIMINIGTNCAAGISVFLNSNPTCSFTFTAPAAIGHNCLPSTGRVTFTATSEPYVPGNCNPTYSSPNFTFD